jgi:hypothetical protein
MSSACERGRSSRQVSKLRHRMCLSRASRIGDTVRDGLKDEVVKPPMINNIIYNIKIGLFENTSLLQKRQSRT